MHADMFLQAAGEVYLTALPVPDLRIGTLGTVTSLLTAHVCVDMCRSDQRADIFSYGVLLWELITQETPQRGNLRDLQVRTLSKPISRACCYTCGTAHRKVYDQASRSAGS